MEIIGSKEVWSSDVTIHDVLVAGVQQLCFFGEAFVLEIYNEKLMLYKMFREIEFAKLGVERKVYNLGSKKGFAKEMEALCDDIAKTFFHI